MKKKAWKDGLAAVFAASKPLFLQHPYEVSPVIRLSDILAGCGTATEVSRVLSGFTLAAEVADFIGGCERRVVEALVLAASSPANVGKAIEQVTQLITLHKKVGGTRKLDKVLSCGAAKWQGQVLTRQALLYWASLRGNLKSLPDSPISLEGVREWAGVAAKENTCILCWKGDSDSRGMDVDFHFKFDGKKPNGSLYWCAGFSYSGASWHHRSVPGLLAFLASERVTINP